MFLMFLCLKTAGGENMNLCLKNSGRLEHELMSKKQREARKKMDLCSYV